MNAYVVITICSLATVLLYMLHHAYFYQSLKEMKRRASHGNPTLRKVALITKYDVTAHVFFDLLKFTLASTSFLLIARNLGTIKAIATIVIFIVVLSYAGRLRNNQAIRLAAFLAPYIEPVLKKLAPLLRPIGELMARLRNPPTTQLFEKEDLKELLQTQKVASNNRIKQEELERALHALEFSSKKIKDYMVPHQDIEFVTTKEPIGPILLSELHKSGFSCFPVQGNSTVEVVGMLHMNDLVKHTAGGIVGSVMDEKVFYVPEDEHLQFVVEAFAQTNAHLFIVVNPQKEVVGLIGIDDILSQIFGHSIEGEFEEYDDIEVVSQR